MAQVSPPLISMMSEQPTGMSSAFEPEYLYLMRFPRIWSSPILGFCMRAPAGDASLALVVVSDGPDERQQMGMPDEILFETVLQVSSDKESAGYSSLTVMFQQPLLGQETIWLGFRLSAPCQIPLRYPYFVGQRTVDKIDVAKLSGSLLQTPMELIWNDAKLGSPILFPIYDAGVDHGA